MEEVQPDTVLTFGPDGMTGHVAHMSVCEWATRAFARSGQAGGAGCTTPPNTQEWADEFVPIYEPFDVFRPGTPPVTPREELSIDFALPTDLLELKLQAIEAHVSQVGAMVDAFGEDIFASRDDGRVLPAWRARRSA